MPSSVSAAELQTQLFAQILHPQPNSGPFDEYGVQVHRDTVRHGLVSALRSAYPVLDQALGEDCFTRLALDFALRHPPREPWLHSYGEGLSEFIAHTPLSGHWPWLSDVARLEWARHSAYFAPDHSALSATQIAACGEEWMSRRLQAHPSLQCLRLSWAVLPFWQAHQSPLSASPPAISVSDGSLLVVWRTASLMVEQQSLEIEAGRCLVYLLSGRDLSEALGSALAEGLDPAPVLAQGLRLGWFSAW